VTITIVGSTGMGDKVRWGVLGVADIAVRRVIPAMQASPWARIAAIASRDPERASKAAGELNISRAYGTYQALLDDPGIEAVYIPLPNHLHVPWTIKAAEAGKHVLCEKPIGLNTAEVRALMEVQARTGVRIQEAHMTHHQPQWKGVLDLLAAGRIGAVRGVMGYFGYFNDDPRNIRNVTEFGGGALLDVGCYLVHASRRIFGETPRRVIGLTERDPVLKTDVLTSAMFDFDRGQSVFTCSTQGAHEQRLVILGSRASIEMELPFNATADRFCRISINDGEDLSRRDSQLIEYPPSDQYTIQGDEFSRAIRENKDQPLPLAESLQNMAVIEAIFRSAESGKWEVPVA